MRSLQLTVIIISACLAAVPSSHAQNYPVKPIRVINPYTPGGGVDAVLRPLTQKMSENLKQNILVEYRPGANGMIGSEAVARSAPDGYTLLAGTTSALTMNPAIYTKVSYEPVKDFVPISNFAEAAFILSVHPSVPAKNVKEFIALAKARPNQLTYASFGVGSIAHLGAELFSIMTGVTMLHVPYKGSVPAVTDLVAGHVMLIFDSMQSQMPQVRANRLRPLGIAAAKRSPAAPEIPTISEAGVPGFELVSWYGVLAPANTPREIITRLHSEIVKALATPDVRERIESYGTVVVGNTPEEFASQIRGDVAKWAKVARAANIRAE